MISLRTTNKYENTKDGQDAKKYHLRGIMLQNYGVDI